MISWDKPERFSEYDPTHVVFRDLMSYRVREVLLVSSLYDSYILEEDGQLSESLDAEFYQLNLATSPRITQVPTAEEALALLEKRPFDLVITMARLGGMDVSSGRWTWATTTARGAVSCSEKHSAADDVQENERPARGRPWICRDRPERYLPAGAGGSESGTLFLIGGIDFR